MSDLLALGISHKTAPIELRERVALPEGRAASVLRELVSTTTSHEAVVLSTCNRTELYLAVGDDVEAETAALGILARQGDIRPTELSRTSTPCATGRRAPSVPCHRRARRDDPRRVGDPGPGQARIRARAGRGTTSAFMNRLFRVRCSGKRVRSDTHRLARVSMSSVAVRLAQETLGDLTGKRVIVIGAGETGELTARALTEQGVRSVFVANRHYDRAIGLAQRFGGQAVRFDAAPAELERADIVLSSTSSPHHIIGRDELAAVMERRGGRPLLAIDIAVPRDIDPAVAELEGVHLRDVDDLQRLMERRVSGREAEARRADALLDRELERFRRWLATLDVVPTIAALHERGDAIVEQVLEENAGRWQALGRRPGAARADRLDDRQAPAARAGAAAEGRGDGRRTYVYVQALRELFGLEAGGAVRLRAASGGARRGTPRAPRASRRSGARQRRAPLSDPLRYFRLEFFTILRSAPVAARLRWPRRVRSPTRWVRASSWSTIVTSGDRDAVRRQAALRQGDRGRASAGDVDLAVHSAKDLPESWRRESGSLRSLVRRTRGTRSSAPESLDELSAGGLVGTSSLRRRSQLLAIRPDLEVAQLRGNVDTRLEELAPGGHEAIVLALAGLRRLGRGTRPVRPAGRAALRPGARSGTARARDPRRGRARGGRARAPRPRSLPHRRLEM